MIQKMSDDAYFAMDAISNSYISSFLRCPAATQVKVETTPAMAFGSAVHCMVLEGADEFGKRYAVQFDKFDKRTKEGKAAAEEFARLNLGKIVLSGDDFQTICSIYQSILTHPMAKDLLADAVTEMAVTWTDPDTGLKCKAKADALLNGDLIDLKTMADGATDAKGMASKLMARGYHRQMAFYGDGVKANDMPVHTHIIIAVDTTAPYGVGVYRLTKDLLEAGRKQYREALARIKDFEMYPYDTLPAYNSPLMVDIDLPNYLKENNPTFTKGN